MIKNQALRIFPWVSAITAIAALATTSASAATCNVPSGSYPTIQSAASDPVSATRSMWRPASTTNGSDRRISRPPINGAQAGNLYDAPGRPAPASRTVNGSGSYRQDAVFSDQCSGCDDRRLHDHKLCHHVAAHGVSIVERPSNERAHPKQHLRHHRRQPIPRGNGTAQAVYLTATARRCELFRTMR